MKTFLKTIWNFFAVIGFLTVILIAVLTYIVWNNPVFYSIAASFITPTVMTSDETQEEIVEDRALFSADQQEALQGIGIDPQVIPEEITPQMQACFIEKLGEERVTEIIAGAQPTLFEIVQAIPCIE